MDIIEKDARMIRNASRFVVAEYPSVDSDNCFRLFFTTIFKSLAYGTPVMFCLTVTMVMLMSFRQS